MEIHGGIAALLVIALLVIGCFAGAGIFSSEKEVIEYVVTEKLVNTTCAACPEIEIPEFESADNYLLNEFLEKKFKAEFDAIKDAAEPFALEELMDDDYEVVVDYLKTLLAEGEELDEDSVDVHVDETDVEVTKLGLGEDEDKAARVTFEIEVEYELEEGVRDEFEKDLVVVYDVVFEDGYLDDEEVEFVSIA